MSDHRDEILALLEAGPHRTGELAAWLAVPVSTLLRQLRAMERRGALARVGSGPQSKWTLASVPSSAATPESHATRLSAGRQVSPKAPKPSTDGGASWWCGLDRPALQAAAATRYAAMRETREARSILVRTLQ